MFRSKIVFTFAPLDSEMCKCNILERNSFSLPHLLPPSAPWCPWPSVSLYIDDAFDNCWNQLPLIKHYRISLSFLALNWRAPHQSLVGARGGVSLGGSRPELGQVGTFSHLAAPTAPFGQSLSS